MRPRCDQQSAVKEMKKAQCECSRQSDYCSYPAPSGWKCQGVSSCTVTFDGCGWLYNYACDGMCFRCTC
ncbi:bacteriocin fulvocin C-related protein [Streptosporangium sp. NPDC006007]|uniref:bacteriocin fulvocin C-related protein n=1 Tax=Streptosporangium sp. NPDC006007 TaxID=3154575 RepID=UPI0033A75053